MLRCATRDRSLSIEQLKAENKRGVRRDADATASALRRRASAAISEMRRHDERAAASHAHASKPSVPALDHLAGAQLESDRAALKLLRARVPESSTERRTAEPRSGHNERQAAMAASSDCAASQKAGGRAG